MNLKINNKLDRRAGIILRPYSDLEVLESKIEEYISSKKGNGVSKAEDWIGENEPLNQYIIDNKIRHNYFNFSSKVGPGYSPNIKGGKRVRYVYKA